MACGKCGERRKLRAEAKAAARAEQDRLRKERADTRAAQTGK